MSDVGTLGVFMLTQVLFVPFISFSLNVLSFFSSIFFTSLWDIVLTLLQPFFFLLPLSSEDHGTREV